VAAPAREESGAAASAPPEPYFQLFGFVLVRKADVLAATAFLLALLSTAYQFSGYLMGPRVRQFPPDRILIYFDKYPDGSVATRFAGQTTFSNAGLSGHGATIKDVILTVNGPGIQVRQRWNSFAVAERHDWHLSIKPQADAAALQVPGEQTLSRLITYAPAAERCALLQKCKSSFPTPDDTVFLHAIDGHVGGSLTFTFASSTFEGSGIESVSCDVVLTAELVTALAASDWYLAPCFATESKR